MRKLKSVNCFLQGSLLVFLGGLVSLSSVLAEEKTSVPAVSEQSANAPSKGILSNQASMGAVKDQPQATGLDRKIFLDLRDINVVDVLKFLAFEGGLNIVTSKNVQGRSTLLLKNVTIQDALDIIVISNQLAYELKGDIIYVMNDEEYKQIYGESYNNKRQISTRVLKYAKPTYVLSALQSLQSAVGKVVIDEEMGSVIMIDTVDKLQEMKRLLDRIDKPRETRVVQLQYAKAKDVELQLKPELDAKSVGTIYGDARSNKVIVTAYEGRIDEILPLIQSLDAATKAVMVDVKILQLTINPRFDFGIDWQKTFSKSSNEALRALDFHGAFPIASTVSSTTSLGTVGRIAVGDVTEDEFTTEVKYLKQVQKTNILANPRLTILDREEAKINIGDRIPYVVTTTTGTGNNVSVSEEIKFIDVGINLMVTPQINEKGFVVMKIRPEISSRTGTLTTPAGAQIPLVNTTFVESTVVVKHGNTVILGGLRRDDHTKSSLGVPHLMDVPVVGSLFKNRADTVTKTEIVIFLTPRLITGDQNVTDEPFAIKQDLRASADNPPLPARIKP